MKTLTIHGIDYDLDNKMKEWVKKSGQSINWLVLQLLKSAVGLVEKKPFPIHQDQENLANKKTEGDEIELIQHINSLGQVDKELWK